MCTFVFHFSSNYSECWLGWGPPNGLEENGSMPSGSPFVNQEDSQARDEPPEQDKQVRSRALKFTGGTLHQIPVWLT